MSVTLKDLVKEGETTLAKFMAEKTIEAHELFEEATTNGQRKRIEVEIWNEISSKSKLITKQINEAIATKISEGEK